MVAKQATHATVALEPHVHMPEGTTETDVLFTSFPNAGRGTSWLTYPQDEGEQWEVDDLHSHVHQLLTPTTYQHLLARATRPRRTNNAPVRLADRYQKLADTALPGKGLYPASVPCMKGTSLTHKQRKFVNNTRYGTLWTTALQHRYQGLPASSTPSCPLCHSARDGIAHCLGGCTHPHIRSLIIARHGHLASKIATAIESSGRGNCLMFVDAETHPPRYSLLPEWLAPAQHQSKPDIVLVSNAHLNDLHDRTTPLTRAERHSHHVHLLEVKCTNAFRIHDTVDRALSQHAAMAQHMRLAGWQVTCHALIIDNTGIIPAVTFDALAAIGLARADISRLIPALQLAAISGSHAVYTKRLTLLHSSHAGVGVRMPRQARAVP